MAVPFAFATASGNIALSKLDSNFNTPITIGNTSVLLGNTITTLNNMTLANVTITSGTSVVTNVSVTNINVTNLTASLANITTLNVASSYVTASNVATAVIGNLTLSNALTVPSGGTGRVTIPANNVLLGNGTGAITSVAPGNVGNVLTSVGGSWVSVSSTSANAVTNVSVVSANGFAGTVANSTSNAAITLSTNFTGIAWSNASNQLSNVAIGTGLSFSTTTGVLVATGAVANAVTSVGNTYPVLSTGGTTPNISVASSGAGSVILRDASNNITANAYFNGFTSVAASGTLITLTVASTPVYFITGSGGQIIKLPDATTLLAGTIFSFNNNQSSGAITVNNNSNTLIASVPVGGYVTIVLTANSTAAGSWDRHDQTPSNVSWSTNTLDYPGSITSATWNGANIAVSRGGTGLATIPAGNVVIGNGTSALYGIGPGTAGNVLTSIGGVWTSNAVAGGGGISTGKAIAIAIVFS
jgi:hypothetical protein